MMIQSFGFDAKSKTKSYSTSSLNVNLSPPNDSVVSKTSDTQKEIMLKIRYFYRHKFFHLLYIY